MVDRLCRRRAMCAVGRPHAPNPATQLIIRDTLLHPSSAIWVEVEQEDAQAHRSSHLFRHLRRDEPGLGRDSCSA
jgi:hypothetical protein